LILPPPSTCGVFFFLSFFSKARQTPQNWPLSFQSFVSHGLLLAFVLFVGRFPSSSLKGYFEQ
jgi:hypothetical protein